MKTYLLLAVVGLQLACVMPLRRASAAPPPPSGPLPARIPDVITSSDNPSPPPKISAPPAVEVPVADPSKVVVARDSDPLPPAPPRPRPRRTTPKPAPLPAHVEETLPPEPPPFHLREVLPPARREALLKQTDEMLTFCTKALAQLEEHKLANSQTRLANRVRQFMQEAKNAIDSEPVRARNMAARAKAFAEALLGEWP